MPTPAGERSKFDLGKTLTSDISKAVSGFQAMGSVIAKVSQSSGAAFGAMSAGITAIASAGGPVLFGSLTQSAQLLGATLAGTLIGPIVTVVVKLQQMADFIHNLDPALKASIGHWVGWAGAVLGSAAVIGRVVGMVQGLLPVVGALKAALAFTVANPFGVLLVGLAAVAVKAPEVFTPLVEAGHKLVTALSGALEPLAHLVGRVFEAIATVAGSVLVPVIQTVATIAEAVAGAVTYLAEALGGTSSQFALAAVAAVAFASPLRLIVGAAVAVIAALNSINPALGAVAVGIGVVVVAVRTLTVAIAANPFGALLAVTGAVVGALAAIGGGFASVSASAEKAASAIASVKGRLERIRQEGVVKPEDVEAVLSPEERKKLREAKTPAERRAFYEEKAEQSRREAVGTIPEESAGQVQDLLRLALEKGAKAYTAWGRAGDFGDEFGKQLTEMKLSPEALVGMQAQMQRPEVKFAINDLLLKRGGPAEEDLMKLYQLMNAPTAKAKERTTVLEKAAKGEIEEAPEDDPETPKLKRLKGLNTKYGHLAYNKEMQAQYTQPVQARDVFQMQLLEKNPIERDMLNELREIAINARKTLAELQKKKDDGSGWSFFK